MPPVGLQERARNEARSASETSRLYPRKGISYVDCPELGLSTAELAWLPDNRDEPAVSALREAARRTVRQSSSSDDGDL